MEKNNFYQLNGILFRIDEVRNFEKNGVVFFSKQEFLLLVRNEYQEKVYEEHIRFECVNNKMNELVGLREGYEVCVSFTIRTNESKKDKGTYYNNLRALSVDVLEKVTTEERAVATKAAQEKDAVDEYMDEGKLDAPVAHADPAPQEPTNDLPF